MGLFDFLFANNKKDGSSINHDTLIPCTSYSHIVSTENRQKLIFYFIAERLPSKLSSEDRLQYQSEKTNKFCLPKGMLMLSGLFGPLSYALYANRGTLKRPVRSVSANLLAGAFLMLLADHTFTNLNENKFIDENKVVDELVRYRYNHRLKNMDSASMTSQSPKRNRKSLS